MKFDCIIGNPPYSKNKTPIYTLFYKKCLDKGNVVCMVMPSNLNSKHKRLQEHNKLVKTHSTIISKPVTDYFNVGIKEIRYVLSNKEHINNIIDKEELYTPILPERKRLEPVRGNIKLMLRENKCSDGIECITAINKTGLVIHKIKSQIVHNIIQPYSKFKVIANAYPSLGLFNTKILTDPSIKYGYSVYIFNCNTLEEATTLQQWLISKTIQDEVNELLKLKDTYAISKEMLKLLPGPL